MREKTLQKWGKWVGSWSLHRERRETIIFHVSSVVHCRSLKNVPDHDCLALNFTHMLITYIFDKLWRHFSQIHWIAEIFGDFTLLINSPFPVWPWVQWRNKVTVVASSSSKLGSPWWACERINFLHKWNYIKPHINWHIYPFRKMQKIQKWRKTRILKNFIILRRWYMYSSIEHLNWNFK